MALALGSHQDQVKVASGLNLLVGVWLFASSFVFRETGAVQLDKAIIGVVVAILAGCRSFGGYRPSWPSWVNAILGLWVLISPWVSSQMTYPASMWNSVITGLVIIVLGIWSALATDTDTDLRHMT